MKFPLTSTLKITAAELRQIRDQPDPSRLPKYLQQQMKELQESYRQAFEELLKLPESKP